jgi:hypothetical protein
VTAVVLRRAVVFAVSIALRGLDAQSPLWAGLTPGQFAVGYRVVDTTDVTRSFPAANGAVGARPVRLYVWYPATRGSGAPMRLRSLVLDEPARGGAYELADPAGFARAFVRIRSGPAYGPTLTDAEAESLLTTPLFARRGAVVAGGRFPLVLVSPGSPATMPVTAELLASRGYVVMGTDRKDDHSIQSMAFTPNPESIAAEVGDLEFALGAARGMNGVDASRVAVIGYSSSGISNLAFAARSRVPRALVVFDGWEGRDAGEPILAQLPAFDALSLRGGYLDVESSDFGAASNPVSTFIDAMPRADRWRIRFDSTAHPDFASFFVALPRANPSLRAVFRNAQMIVARFIDDRLSTSATNAAFARGWADSVGIHIGAFPSTTSRPTMDEFYHLAEVDAEAADALALRLAAETPPLVPFTQQGLTRLANILSSRRPRDAERLRAVIARAFPGAARPPLQR